MTLGTMTAITTFLITFAGSSLSSLNSSPDYIDTNTLSEKLEELVEDTLKIKEFQRYLDSLKFETSHSVKEEEWLLSTLEDLFTEISSAVQKLKKDTEEDLNQYGVDLNFSPKIPNCCSLIKAHQTSPCFMSYDEIYPLEKTSTTMIELAKSKPYLKRQYVHFLNKFRIQHPSNPKICENYQTMDYRLDAWYQKTITPTPKELVIAISTSDSMLEMLDGKTKLQTAVSIVLAIMDALSPRDKFSIMTFNARTETLKTTTLDDSCFVDSLAKATALHISAARRYLKGIKTRGGKSYMNVVYKAFHIMQESYDPLTAHLLVRRIVLISDEAPSTHHIDQFNHMVNKMNEKQDHSIAIYSFGIGKKETALLQLSSSASTKA